MKKLHKGMMFTQNFKDRWSDQVKFIINSISNDRHQSEKYEILEVARKRPSGQWEKTTDIFFVEKKWFTHRIQKGWLVTEKKINNP